MLDLLFKESCKPVAYNFITKRLRHRFFPVNFRETFMNAFATEHLHVTAFVNTNLPNMFICDIYDLTTLPNSSDNFLKI